jgi:hypothetical protein
MGRAVEAILDAIGVTHVTAASEDDAEAMVATAAATAFGTRLPTACLLPRRVTVPRPRTSP